jgi:hypothetical protein
MSTCKGCRFYKALLRHNGKERPWHFAQYLENAEIQGYGECHKRAPALSGLSEQEAEEKGITNATFPMLDEEDWCGEHEPEGETK